MGFFEHISLSPSSSLQGRRNNVSNKNLKGRKNANMLSLSSAAAGDPSMI